MKTEDSIHPFNDYAKRYPLVTIIKMAIEAAEINHRASIAFATDFRGGKAEGLANYLRDYRTIRIDLGQRTGRSTAIIELAQPGDLIIGAGEANRELYATSEAKFLTVQQYMEGLFDITEPIRRIWVDDTITLTLRDVPLADFYRAPTVSIEQLFIFLG